MAHRLYEGRLRERVHRLKYEGMEPIADHLSAIPARQVLQIADLPEHTTAIPVPLSRGKQRERDLLACATVEALRRHRPVPKLAVSTRLLAGLCATESQAGLTPHQRRADMRGAFFVPRPEQARAADLLLIHDIYTTGATARACAQALRRSRAHSVATVVRAQRRESLLRRSRNHRYTKMWRFWSSGLVPAACIV